MKPLILVSNDAIKCLGVEVFSYLSGEAIILNGIERRAYR